MLPEPKPSDTPLAPPTPEDGVRILACTLRRHNRSRKWEYALKAAGELDPRSYGLEHPYAEVQAPWMHGAETECYLLNFGRFRCSERIQAYAKSHGYVPAHPRAVAAVAEALPDLPLRLKAPAPLSIASLVPCYREDGEKFVMSVTWNRQFERLVRGVFYGYGWEPQYWLVFEDDPQAANA